MSKKYILAVDGGSQSSKIVIFDLEGNIVCEEKENLRPVNLPSPGIVEHPDDDLWDSIAVASKKTLAKFDGDVKDIMAVGLCTIRFCRALLKKDGSLYSPVMSWMDQRVSRVHEQVSDEIAYVTTSSGYITHRFTGNFNDTAANYQGVWPMDTDTWQWYEDDRKIAEYNLTRDMLFHLQMPGTILGYVTKEASEATGIPEGLPVVATANDKAVEALGAGCTGEKTALISLGTYIAAMAQGHDNPKNTVNFWSNFASVPNQYLYESNGIRRGMWTVSWFKNVLGDSYAEKARSMGMSAEELLSREAEEVPVGSDGLMTVLDFLAPADQPFKKGIMIGFDGRHGRAHMYRSILEGIAMTMKSRVDEMCEELGLKLDNLIISGGGSNSDLFMQIFSDVFGIPASRNVVNGSAAVGSAICAAVAVGAYKTFDEAVAHMVRMRDTFRPDLQNTGKYARANAVYRDITKGTDDLLKRSYEIFS
ncbi:FGGY-family carbohydrate kinase [Caproiciproducens sp. CPB-2]|uniref:FGGY-family carbohydrate kinase n=1 Tax=Caproiciproducens sp. CPB-2 TaxID=3030017 RepID=UPI0023DC534D|nr:FGGY-family carbohydrate kinase [Caproiciproducens sp. CPB-2]MDF1494220.1 FGGY-family carbohydrate kinase [Caproiciproducens sp. CPB-2]